MRDSVSRIGVGSNVRLGSYVDSGGNYLVIGANRTDGVSEQLYLCVLNGKVIVDHQKNDGTWERITLG